MPYTYPPFARVVSIEQEDGKRYRLEIELHAPGRQTWVVIQKNPSRADTRVSDHTINRVLNYLHRNRERYPALRGIGRVVFLNLIPWYETYSERLVRKENALSEPENLKAIEESLKDGNPCIIAWGNPPARLSKAYSKLSDQVLKLLGEFGNPTFQVGPLTRLGYPRHGQIWGYADPLRSYSSKPESIKEV
jgi:hypothetical protein